jgi:hypothetical protein
MSRQIITLLSVCGALSMAAVSGGAVTILEDRNALLRVDDGTVAGADRWEVDGMNHLFQQWFWFRTAADSREFSLDTLPAVRFVQDTNGFVDPRPDTVAILYTGNGFTIQPTFTLRGGQAGSGVSDISETIVITNTGQSTLNISFYQYSDFDLGGTVADADVRFFGAGNNTASQTDIGVTISETILTPQPDLVEANFFSTTRDALEDAVITNLNNDPGPLGPGDLTWAVQWDLTIAPGASVQIVKDKSIVPTPGAAALLAVAGALGLRRRR